MTKLLILAGTVFDLAGKLCDSVRQPAIPNFLVSAPGLDGTAPGWHIPYPMPFLLQVLQDPDVTAAQRIKHNTIKNNTVQISLKYLSKNHKSEQVFEVERDVRLSICLPLIWHKDSPCVTQAWLAFTRTWQTNSYLPASFFPSSLILYSKLLMSIFCSLTKPYISQIWGQWHTFS